MVLRFLRMERLVEVGRSHPVRGSCLSPSSAPIRLWSRIIGDVTDGEETDESVLPSHHVQVPEGSESTVVPNPSEDVVNSSEEIDGQEPMAKNADSVSTIEPRDDHDTNGPWEAEHIAYRPMHENLSLYSINPTEGSDVEHWESHRSVDHAVPRVSDEPKGEGAQANGQTIRPMDVEAADADDTHVIPTASPTNGVDANGDDPAPGLHPTDSPNDDAIAAEENHGSKTLTDGDGSTSALETRQEATEDSDSASNPSDESKGSSSSAGSPSTVPSSVSDDGSAQKVEDDPAVEGAPPAEPVIETSSQLAESKEHTSDVDRPGTKDPSEQESKPEGNSGDGRKRKRRRRRRRDDEKQKEPMVAAGADPGKADPERPSKEDREKSPSSAAPTLGVPTEDVKPHAHSETEESVSTNDGASSQGSELVQAATVAPETATATEGEDRNVEGIDPAKGTRQEQEKGNEPEFSEEVRAAESEDVRATGDASEGVPAGGKDGSISPPSEPEPTKQSTSAEETDPAQAEGGSGAVGEDTGDATGDNPEEPAEPTIGDSTESASLKSADDAEGVTGVEGSADDKPSEPRLVDGTSTPETPTTEVPAGDSTADMNPVDEAQPPDEDTLEVPGETTSGGDDHDDVGPADDEAVDTPTVDEPTNTSSAQVDTPADATADAPADVSGDASAGGPADVSADASADVSRDVSADASAEASAEVLEDDAAIDAAQVAPEEGALAETPADLPAEAPPTDSVVPSVAPAAKKTLDGSQSSEIKKRRRRRRSSLFGIEFLVDDRSYKSPKRRESDATNRSAHDRGPDGRPRELVRRRRYSEVSSKKGSRWIEERSRAEKRPDSSRGTKGARSAGSEGGQEVVGSRSSRTADPAPVDKALRPHRPERRNTGQQRESSPKPSRPKLFGMLVGVSDTRPPLWVNPNKDRREPEPSSSRPQSNRHHRSTEDGEGRRLRRDGEKSRAPPRDHPDERNERRSRHGEKRPTKPHREPTDDTTSQSHTRRHRRRSSYDEPGPTGTFKDMAVSGFRRLLTAR